MAFHIQTTITHILKRIHLQGDAWIVEFEFFFFPPQIQDRNAVSEVIEAHICAGHC